MGAVYFDDSRVCSPSNLGGNQMKEGRGWYTFPSNWPENGKKQIRHYVLDDCSLCNGNLTMERAVENEELPMCKSCINKMKKLKREGVMSSSTI